jgi:AsmA protein
MGEALFKGTFKQGAKGIEETLKKGLLGGSKPSGTTGTTGSTGTTGTTGDTKTTDKPVNPLKKLFQ